jgi:hypothetical protein
VRRTAEDSEDAKGTLILADGAVCREVDSEKLIFEIRSLAGTVGLQVRCGKDNGRRPHPVSLEMMVTAPGGAQRDRLLEAHGSRYSCVGEWLISFAVLWVGQ